MDRFSIDDMVNRPKFVEVLLEHSVAETYDEAILEWSCVERSVGDGKNISGHCICGQAIYYNNHMRNVKNGNELVVGSDCLSLLEMRSSYMYLQLALSKCTTLRGRAVVSSLLKKWERYGLPIIASRDCKSLELVTGVSYLWPHSNRELNPWVWDEEVK